MVGFALGLTTSLCSGFAFAEDALSTPAAGEGREEAVVEVRGQRERLDTAGLSVRASEARTQAGNLGDAVKTLETAPGTARGGAGGQLIAWGSAASESAYLVDGVPVPFLFHGSSVRSVVPTEQLAMVRFIPGAFGAEHGRALGGVVSLTTRAPARERVELSARADLLDASVRLSSPVRVDASMTAVAREGYLDRWISERIESNDTSQFVVPSYRDWSVQGRVDLDSNRSWTVAYLASEDAFSATVPPHGTAPESTQSLSREFMRLYASYQSDDGLERVTVTPFVGTGGETLAVESGVRGYRLALENRVYGVRTRDTLRFGPPLSLSLGFDALGALTDVERYGTLTMPAREGDPYAFGVGPASDTASDSFSTHVLDVAPYVELSLHWRGLTLTPGLRADTYLIETSALRPVLGSTPRAGGSNHALAPEPRMAVRYDLDESVALLGALGRYQQAPAPADLSPVFGNPELGPSRAFHAAFGEWVRLAEGVEVEVLGFYKSLADLPVRAASESPHVARALEATGTGRVVGAQMDVRVRQVDGWSGWFAWTVSRSERQDRAGAPVRRFDFDQTHVVSWVLQKQLGPWVPSARFRHATGAPRTPVVGAYYNVSSNTYEPVFGATNSVRLPDFVQLDVRLEWERGVGQGAFAASVEVLNVTGRANAEEVVYSRDFEERGVLSGLPRLLNVGIRYER